MSLFDQVAALTRKVNKLCCIVENGGGGGADITVQDDGTPLTTAVTLFNFTGDGVTASVIGTDVTVNIPGGTSFTRTITSVNSNTAAGSAASTDYVYLASNAITITMPAAASNTNLYTIKRVGTDLVQVDGGGANIDGSASINLNVQYQSVNLVSDGTNWNII